MFSFSTAFATHQKAAEISFKHISGYTYQIRLTTYTFTESLTDREELIIQWGDNTTEFIPRANKETILYPNEKTKENHYYATHTYSGPGHYYISMEDADRNGGVINMPSSVSTPMFVQTLLIISPFIDPPNSSPILLNKPFDKACLNTMFIHNPGAYDPDGDSLSYKLTVCKGSGGEDIVGFYQPHASKEFYIDSISGNLIWNSPIEQGEFNVAMIIEEWRDGFKISETTRDMQISVQACDNRPPKESLHTKYCIEAGQELVFDVTATDPDSNDYITLTATGGVFELSSNERAEFTSTKEKDSVSGRFAWRPPYSAARTQAYPVYFKATDNGNPNLSDIQTAFIHVFAPAVEFDSISAQGKNIYLRWEQTPCPQAYGYQIYRRQGTNNDTSFENCLGGLNDSLSLLIATIRGRMDTCVLDSLNLVDGMQYCYRIVVLLNDGAKGYASNDVCTELQNGNPIMTQVSIENTDTYEGEIWLAWNKPPNIDSNILKECIYEIYRRTSTEEMTQITTLDYTQTSFSDKPLNTTQKAYFYTVHIRLATDSLHGNPPMGKSDEASSIFLQTIGRNHKVELSWNYKTPWLNRKFTIYRYNSATQDLDSIGSTSNNTYSDKGLENDSTYLYVILAEGTYFSSAISNSSLKSWSNMSSATTRLEPPCTPVLRISSSECQPFQNDLVWEFDSSECYEDISHYILYYKLYKDKDFDFLSQERKTSFLHQSPPSYFGCYAVSAVNSSGQESGLSSTVCADNRPCFNYKLPNVFTPNNDGINDYFKALPNQYVENFRISIFSSWGLLVFTSTDPNFTWDGNSKMNGKSCPTGSYFYVAEFSSADPSIDFNITETGVVMILR